MGFLNVKGNVLTFNNYKDRIEQYKKHGLNQFISLFQAHKDQLIPLEDLKWGEESEYQVMKMTPNGGYMMSNRGLELIEVFNNSALSSENGIVLMPEFGGWMVEAVPKDPYKSIIDAEELLSCETKLSNRRIVLEEFFKQYNISIISMSNAPGLGTPNHIELLDEDLKKQYKEAMPDLKSLNQYSQSRFVLDKTCNPHPRFGGLSQSIRERRGKKVEIRVPIFKDENTNMTEETADEPYPGEIYMDAMHFGMGQCCLQITYECQTLNHARYLHDMLMPFTGIISALSAAAPIQKGQLSDNDFRWTVLEQSVDCRTDEEKDPKSQNHIPKSRYSSMNHYISNHKYIEEKHNDSTPIKFDENHKQILMKEGIDSRLAEHIARLFARDPVPSYEGEFLDENQSKDEELISQFKDHLTCHFENLQSTNWNSMRFKPPPSQESKIGWRVEFRPLDIQLTDFENTCLIVLMGLLTNVCNHFNVNFILPISLSDVNMQRAHERDSVLNQKFWFNKNCVSDEEYWKSELQNSDYLISSKKDQLEPEFVEYTIQEILIGQEGSTFNGIYPLIKKFMELKEYKTQHVEQIEHILDFLLARAKGDIPTGAKFIRELIVNNEFYNQDSKISPALITILIKQILKLHKDEEFCACECNTNSDSNDIKAEEFKNEKEFRKYSQDITSGDSIFTQPKQVHIGQLNKDISLQNNLIETLGLPKDDLALKPKDRTDSVRSFIEAISQHEFDEKHLSRCREMQVKINKMLMEKTKARTKLLGSQWYKGRTGYEALAGSNENSKEGSENERKQSGTEQIQS